MKLWRIIFLAVKGIYVIYHVADYYKYYVKFEKKKKSWDSKSILNLDRNLKVKQSAKNIVLKIIMIK